MSTHYRSGNKMPTRQQKASSHHKRPKQSQTNKTNITNEYKTHIKHNVSHDSVQENHTKNQDLSEKEQDGLKKR